MSALSVFLKGAAKKLVEDGAEMAVKKDAKAAVRGGAELAVKRAERKALPAPAKRLALPAPDPKRPTYKINNPGPKPRGGQWLPDVDFGQLNYSPEHAARKLRRSAVSQTQPELGDWLEKALTKYVKNDMGTENDPLRALADRGLLQGIDDGGMWDRTAHDLLQEDDAGYYQGLDHLFGSTPADAARLKRTDPFLRDVQTNMPWINKVPSTDPVFGLSPHGNIYAGTGFEHVVDELQNAVRHGTDLPPNLAVRPESLNRMSWPQAVEHTGAINQWRQAQMAAEQANIVASNPAFAVHKQYPENNPLGLAWYQIRQPEYDESVVPEGWQRVEGGLWRNGNATGAAGDPKHSDDHPLLKQARQNLQQALKSEGDAMGHCVGGYCDDVARGDSLIYSLRDAKGEPHVTIEASPNVNSYSGFGNDLNTIQPGIWDQITAHEDFYPLGGHGTVEKHFPDLWEKYNTPAIVQIKGKQNLKPKEDYLPFVQDFIKSGKWSDVGDLHNADMYQLPDARYIGRTDFNSAAQRAAEAVDPDTRARILHSRAGEEPRVYNPRDWGPDVWNTIAKHFEGYAKGGLVVKRGCDCGCGDLSVRRAA